MNVFEQLDKQELFEICCRLRFYLVAFYSISSILKILLWSFLGGGIRAGLAAKRNVVCLEEDESKLRESTATITAAVVAEAKEQDELEIEEEDKEDLG